MGKFTGKGCQLVNNVESYYFVSGHNTSASTETRRASPAACVCVEEEERKDATSSPRIQVNSVKSYGNTQLNCSMNPIC